VTYEGWGQAALPRWRFTIMPVELQKQRCV